MGPLAAAGVGLGASALGSALGGGQQPTTTSKPILTNISGGGLFDTSFNGKQATMSLSPEMQAIQQGLFGMAGGTTPFQQQAAQMGQGFLSQVGAFDPWQAAQTQFQRIEDILAPMRERERASQESRLFAQGRLGSTGGALEQESFQNAIEQQRAQNLINSLGQAQDIQGQLIKHGAFLGQLPMDQQSQALQDLLGIQSAGLQQLRGGAFGGSVQSTEQPSLKSMIGSGLMMGGMGMMGQGLGAFGGQ